MKKILAVLAVFLLLLAFLSLRGTGMNGEQNAGQNAGISQPEQDAGSANAPDEKTVGGPFTLTDQNGHEVHDSDFRGRLMLVYLGFTHCPDICPITTGTMSKAMGLLGDKADSVAPLFITVDPERDSPAVLKDYLSNFDRHMIGLTGSKEQLGQVVDNYKAYVSQGETPNAELPDEDADSQEAHEHAPDAGAAPASGGFDHSGFIYLMGKDGNYITHFPYDATPEQIADAVRANLK